MIVDKLRKVLASRGIVVSELFEGKEHVNMIQFKNKIKPLGLLGRELDRMF
jgi:hypothetical protein